MSSILLSIWTTIKGYFDLSFQRDDEAVVIAQIRESVNFRGVNSWVLIFAIFIASLGLNVNSTAVIIGAMLISPLMGPIIGLGLAIAINDLELLKQSFRNLAAATLISVLTATVYFYITPLDEAQSELLARTSPTIYDVLIALFGGAAGILALSMKGRGGLDASAMHGGLRIGHGAALLLLRCVLFVLYQHRIHRSCHFLGCSSDEVHAQGRNGQDTLCQSPEIHHRSGGAHHVASDLYHL